MSPTTRQEYNSQDFFGQIDEMRIWRRVRSPEEIAAGMRSSLDAKARTGRPGTGPVINPKDDDLVAYWNFDEGQGYSVNDITGKGHTLLATQPTRWEVVRWLAACGNGILEPGEECDDGGLTNGDGCSSECKVQPGWECTATSPSRCWKKGEKPPTPPSGPSSGGGDVPTPPTPDPGSPKKSHAVLRGMLIAIGVCAAVMVAAAAAYTQRHAVYERFPVVEDAVEDAVAAVREWVTALGRGRGRYAFAGDGVLDVDPGDMGSPEFTRSMPAPGRGGYMPLPGSAPRGA